MILDEDSTNALLERYKLHTVVKSHHASGTDVTIRCFDDVSFGRIVMVASGDRYARRLSPIDGERAEEMLKSTRFPFASEGHVARMIAHLVTSLCRLFEDENLSELLVAVRIGENSYDLLSAGLWSTRVSHVHARRESGDGRDRKATYRPLGTHGDVRNSPG